MDVNVYDDVPNFDLGEEVEKLKCENRMLMDHIQSLEEDIEKLTGTIVKLKETQDNLTKNISSLFVTAKTEIERKDRMITDLRAEIDNMCFRRRNPDVEYKRKERENTASEINIAKRFRYERREDNEQGWHGSQQRYSPDRFSNTSNRSRSRSRDRVDRYRDESINTYSDRNRNDYDTDRFDIREKRFHDRRYAEAPRYPEKNFGYGDLRNERTTSLERPTHARQQSPVIHHKDEAIHKSNEERRPSSRSSSVERGTETFPYARYVPRPLPPENKPLDKTAHAEQKADKLGHTTNTNKSQPIKKRLKMLDVVEEKVKKMKSTPVKLNNRGGIARETKTAPSTDVKAASKNLLTSKTFIPGKSGKSSLSPNKIIRTTGPLTKRRESISDGSKNIIKAKKPQLKAGNSEGNIASNAVDNSIKTSLKDSSSSSSVREKYSSTEIGNSKTHSKERKGSDEQLPRKPCVDEEIEQYIIIDSDEEESTDSNADQIRAVAASITEKASKEKTETDIEFKETSNSNVTKNDGKDKANKTSDEDKNCKNGIEEFDKEQKEYVGSMEDIRRARGFEAEEKRTAKTQDVNNIGGSYENRENQVGIQFNAESMKSDNKVDDTEEKEESDGSTLKEEGNKTVNVTVDVKEKEADSQSQNGEKKELRSEQNTNSTATSCKYDKINVEIGQKVIDDTTTHAENETTKSAEVGDKVVPSHKDEEDKPNKESNRKHKSVGIQQETSYQSLEKEEAGKEELKKGTTVSTNISKEERNIKKQLDDEYKQDVMLEQKVNDDVIVVDKEEEKEESCNMRNIKSKDDKTIDNRQCGVEGKGGVDCNVAATDKRDEKEEDSKGKARAELSENDEDIADSLRNKEKKMEIDQDIREERQDETEPKKALQKCIIEDKRDKSDVKKTSVKTIDDSKKKKEDMLTVRISKKEGELKQMVDKSVHDKHITSKQPNKSSEKVAGICNTGSKNTKPVKADTILGPKKNIDFVVENRKTERKEMDNQPKKDSIKKLEVKLSQVDVVRHCRSEGTKPEKRRLSSASSTSPNANIPTESFKEGAKKFKSVSDDSTNSTKQTGGSATTKTLQKEDDVKASSKDNSKSAVKENISSKRSSSKDSAKDSKSETAKTKQEKIEKKDVEKLTKGNASKDNAITDPAPVKTAVNQDVQETRKTGSIRTAKEEKCEIKEDSVKNYIQRDERIFTKTVNRNNSPVNRTISSKALVKEKTQELKKNEVESLEKKEPSSKKNVQKDIRFSTEGRTKDKRSNDHTELSEAAMKENIPDAKKVEVEKLEKKELAVKKDTQKDTKTSTECISEDKTPVSSTMPTKASLKKYIQEARKVREEKDSQKDPKMPAGDSSKDNRLTDYVGSFKALENEIMQEMKKTQEELLEKKVSIAKKTAQKESIRLTEATKNKDDLAIDYSMSTTVLAKEDVQETEKTKNEVLEKKGTSTIKGIQKDVPLQGPSTKENRFVGPLMSKSKDNILEARGTREEPEKKQFTKEVDAQKDTKAPTKVILDNNSPIDYTMPSKPLGRESLQERKKAEDGSQKKNELNTEKNIQRDVPSEGVSSKNNRTMEPLMSKVKAPSPKMRPAKEILEKKQVVVKKDVQKHAKVPTETPKRKSSSPVVQTRVPKILLNDIQHAKKAGLVKKGVSPKKPIQKDTKVPTEGNRSKDRKSVGSLDLKTKQGRNETRKSPSSKNNSVTTEGKKPEPLGTPKQRNQSSKQPELSTVAKKSGSIDTLELNEKANKLETFNKESVKVSKDTVITESLNISTKQLAEVAVAEIRDAEKTIEHSTISNKDSKTAKKQLSESKTSESVLGNNDRSKQLAKSGKTVHVIDCTIIRKGKPDNTPRGDLLSKAGEGIPDPSADKIDGTTPFNQVPVKRASDYNLPSTVESSNFEKSTCRRETVAENTVPKKINSQSEITQGQASNESGRKTRIENISRCLQARAESRANSEGAALPPKVDQGSSSSTTISNKTNVIKTPDTKVTKRRITPTPVKDETPICSFENILEKTSQSGSFSNISMKTSSLHLTHEGEIPVLHLEDNHFSNLPMDANINDKNIMTLLDTMNISNIECELPKFKSVSNESVSEAVSPFSSSFTFENVINKATSTPIVPKSESKETINNTQNSAVESISSSTSNTSINMTAPSVTSSFIRRRRRCRLVIKD